MYHENILILNIWRDASQDKLEKRCSSSLKRHENRVLGFTRLVIFSSPLCVGHINYFFNLYVIIIIFLYLLLLTVLRTWHVLKTFAHDYFQLF